MSGFAASQLASNRPLVLQAPAVAYLAVDVFGYVQSSKPVSEMTDSERMVNVEALAQARAPLAQHMHAQWTRAVGHRRPARAYSSFHACPSCAAGVTMDDGWTLDPMLYVLCVLTLHTAFSRRSSQPPRCLLGHCCHCAVADTLMHWTYRQDKANYFASREPTGQQHPPPGAASACAAGLGDGAVGGSSALQTPPVSRRPSRENAAAVLE